MVNSGEILEAESNRLRDQFDVGRKEEGGM